MGLQETPSANRIHIGFFGRRNSGKSSLLNAFCGQSVSIVSAQAGTTTDPVSKPMEIHGLGPCVLIDTAGFDDTGDLGRSRMERTERAAEKTEIALLLCGADAATAGGMCDNTEADISLDLETAWYAYFREHKIPVIPVVSKSDLPVGAQAVAGAVTDCLGETPVIVSAKTGEGLQELRERLLRALPEGYGNRSITGDLVQAGDVALLVMPQDIQAPAGRLILPQVQTIRELLDKKCMVMSVTTDGLEDALAALQAPPKLIITDSQAFRTVSGKKPPESLLTSFSVLFAAQKGDIAYYKDSAEAIGRLTDRSRVLIAECCTHAPLEEDIGRVKLPRMLRQRCGGSLTVEIVSGTDFPADLTGYDLIIQCGACMFNRRYVMARVERARSQGVPMTNYGVAIAWLAGILDSVSI